MALTIGLREMFDLCTFDKLVCGNLGGTGFVDFNVDLVLLGLHNQNNQ